MRRRMMVVSLLLTSITMLGWHAFISACPNNSLGECPETGICKGRNGQPEGNCTYMKVGNNPEWACWKLWQCGPNTAQECTPWDSPRCSGKIIKHPECAEWAYTRCNAQLRGCNTNHLYDQYYCTVKKTVQYSRFVDCSC